MRRSRRGWREVRHVLSAAVMLALAGATAAWAQESPVKWSLSLPDVQGAVNPGGVLRARMVARLDSGWHLYSVDQPPPPIATKIRVPAGQPFALSGAVEAPAAAKAFDGNFNMEVGFYTAEATFLVPVQVDPTARAGRYTLLVTAYYQTCNDQYCLPPRTDRAEAQVEIAAGPPLTASGARTAAPTRGGASVTPSGSLVSFLWLALTMGALALLTPCVFPMVPITVSYFTKNAAGHRGAAIGRAFTYALGIILTFTALGMLLAVVVGATSMNQFAASPWVNLLITAIFVAFALNLFGAFELQLPVGLVNRLDRIARREGGSAIVGTLLMGFVFTLTSFTCTVPFVGTLLVMAAQGQWQWPLVGMLAFSTTFAAPFFLLALAPQLVSQVPRSGAWMNAVKVLMGFLEVAAAMKFVSNVDLVWRWGLFTREVVLATWVGIGLLMALYVLGVFRLSHEEERVERVGAGRLVTAMVCLTLTVWLLTGVLGRRLGELDAFLPPATEEAYGAAGTQASATRNELPWVLNDFDGALARASREGKRLFVDFTGYTCTNCRWMEANMFPRSDVRSQLERYVRVRLYTDGDGELFRKQQAFQQATFKTVALPFYVVFDPSGSPVATFPGLTRNAAEFVAFLSDGLAK